MRKINFPLLLGSIIVIFMLLVAFYPGLFTSNDPLYEETPRYMQYEEEGKLIEKFTINPLPPNKQNIFGTDDAGRDLYARLVYGTRNTLKLAFLTALFRMLLALPLGIAAGMGIRFVSSLIKIFNIFFTAIPMLIFSYVTLNIGYFGTLEINKAILAFTAVLTIVGWAKLSGMIEDSTRRVMEEDFIEGEIAIGKTKLQIAWQNVLPHIIPSSISLFFKEMGMALFLIAQLAVLFVFVGVTRRVKESAMRANYAMILEPEWGGALSRISINLKKFDSVYWTTLYPVLVFSLAIVGINLTGEGLRIEFEKRESRVISSIRKAYYLVSPRIFISQIRTFKKYYKPVIIKVSIIAGIIACSIIPLHPSRYEFDIEHAKLQLEELVNEEYGGRVTGTEGGYLAGEYIMDTLSSYGYQVDTMEIPITTDEATMPEVMAPMLVEAGWIKLKDEKGEEKTYQLHKDFTILTLSESIFNGPPNSKLHYKGVAADLQNAGNISEGVQFFSLGQNLREINMRDYKTANQVTTRQGKVLSYDIQFVLAEDCDRNTNAYLYKCTTIIPFEALRLELQSGYREVEIDFNYPKLPKYNGRNITAFLPGGGKTKEEPGEMIIIGASYDGVNAKGEESSHAVTAAPAATALEVARMLSKIHEPFEKSIQFVFWDNESEILKNSPLDGSYYYNVTEQKTIDMALSHGYYYFDISSPGLKQDKVLNFITLPPQLAPKSSYLMGLEMERRLKQLNAKYHRYFYGYQSAKALANMRLNALTSIGVGNTYIDGINSGKDNIENINYKGMEVIGQLILDTMTMNSYTMD